jgi:hypothetical protein
MFFQGLVFLAVLLARASGSPDSSTPPAIDWNAHQWIAPGPNDLRGPCPGLNTYVFCLTNLDMYLSPMQSCQPWLPAKGWKEFEHVSYIGRCIEYVF